MTGLTVSDLPPELLYTILSHALADVLFDFLFVGALVPNDSTQPKAAVVGSPGGLDEISSLGGVSVAWRITVQRILGAVLNTHTQPRPNLAVQSLKKQQQQQHRVPHHQLTTASLLPTSIHYSISASAEVANDNSNVTWIDSASATSSSLQQCRSTLYMMQTTLRDLVQNSIDTYRSEQDTTAHTGVTTPTLLPVPLAPQAPHSTLLPLPQVLFGAAAATTGGASHAGATAALTPNGHFGFSAALLQSMPPAMKAYASNPLFHEALCYSQAAVFTCSSRACNPSPIRQRPGVSASCASVPVRVQRATHVQRPDLSTISLNTGRLVSALEWVRMREVGESVSPSEIGNVAECGMRDVREQLEEALQVCRWNDLLDGVFLRGERGDEILEALEGCFDALEANASTIQMHHLLRSNLFKTVQTIGRLGPISLGGPQSGRSTPSSSLNSNGEAWRSRAATLAIRWTGRVIEWTGV